MDADAVSVSQFRHSGGGLCVYMCVLAGRAVYILPGLETELPNL